MRIVKFFALTTLMWWCASSVSGETESPQAKINISNLKFPSVFGDLSNVPRRIDTVNNLREITISPDGRAGVVTWRYQDEFGSHTDLAVFMLNSARIGCPCCPTPLVADSSPTASSSEDLVTTTTSESSTSTPADSTPCCVPCDTIINASAQLQSVKSESVLLDGKTSVLVQSTLMIPSEGNVVVRAYCYVERNFENPSPSALEFGIISEGGTPFQSWEMKKFEPVDNPSESQVLLTIEKEFPVTQGSTNIKLSARSLSENLGDMAQLRMLLVTFVPTFGESALK